MSYLLWKFYFEDDAESFCHLLGEAAVVGRSAVQRSYLHEPSSLNTPTAAGLSASFGAKSSAENESKAHLSLQAAQCRFSDLTLTRADVNQRDGKGLTLLHHAASRENENSKAFALALISHPLIDLHAQDLENGWNALHRAFYFGNISVARAILEKESQDAIGPAGLTIQAASLIKTKDQEGNGPWDILTAIIKDRTLRHVHLGLRNVPARDDEEDIEHEPSNEKDYEINRRGSVEPHIDLNGDEVFAFGSNRNFNLGLNNQDDRYFPERIKLNRPNHLFRRFHREHMEHRISRVKGRSPQYAAKLENGLQQHFEAYAPPSIIRSKPISIQDVQMSKFHTAILTSDPFPNLYLCGHGFGGRLGVGDEKTRFNFVCIEELGSVKRRVTAVALGQDHTLAVTDQGDLLSWGSNAFGQLGMGFSKNDGDTEEPPCLSPKKIYGPLKREVIVGVAASRIHSVAHTTSALYTFGKNEGQLGIVDAQSGSLKFQPTPRRVAASRFSCSILSVSAIDRATVCLLESHEVHVFANYGIVKLMFPLDQFANPLSEKSDTATRYDASMPSITKVTCGGDMICALSDAGEIFAVTVDQRLEPGASGNASTTKPNKIRHALSQPLRIWSLKKGHMSAMDLAVDQDGSVVITTESGSVWRRMHRTTLSASRPSIQSDKKSKEFKITRVPGLTRVIAVRASASGAYCAIRDECDVTKMPVTSENTSIWKDMIELLPFKDLIKDGDYRGENFVTSKRTVPELLKRNLSLSKDLEGDMSLIFRNNLNQRSSTYDAFAKTSLSDVKIPIHVFIVAARSKILRDIFSSCRMGHDFFDDVMTVYRSEGGQIILEFKGVDFATVVEFVLYAYTDQFVGFWLLSKQAPTHAYRYRSIRLELLKITTRLDFRSFESAVRKWAPTAPLCLDKDLEMALADSRYFENADASVQLRDGEMSVHSGFVSRRCPFFEELFEGSAAGRWLDERRSALQSPDDKVSVDLTHVEIHVFHLVLRHIYADIGEELFDDIICKDLDEFLDLILDVLSVANELMLDRLSQTCQELLGRYVTARNVCQLLNVVAPCAITLFKDAALEFICLNLEAMLSNHLLDELDEDLLDELDEVVQDNQLNSLPYAKSGRANLQLHERHPELAETILRDKYAQLDRMRIHSKYPDQHWRSSGTSLNVEYEEKASKPKSSSYRKHSFSQATQKIGPKNLSTSHEGARVKKDYFDPPSVATPRSTHDFESNPEGMLTPSSPAFTLPAPGVDGGTVSEAIQTRSVSFSRDISDSSNPSLSAWGQLPLKSDKLGMKEIMEQASSSRVSNLSLGFAAQARANEASPLASQLKVSQKERRRQQQRQRHRDSENKSEGASAAQTSSSEAHPSSSPRSPWQTVSLKSKPITQESSIQTSERVSAAKPNYPRSSPTPQLTMRQTIANSSPMTGEKEEIPEVLPVTPKQQRTVSTPQLSTSKTGSAGFSSEASSKPVEVQSIRHIPKMPLTASPTSQRQYSLADIRLQQQAEKTSVKEAVAKRSLQEIQQEQEFQQWWDQESQRVMAEEAAATRAAAAAARGSRGRGRGSKGRTRRGGKGKSREEAGGPPS